MYKIAFWHGIAAYSMGFDAGHNPYRGSPGLDWLQGWQRGQSLAGLAGDRQTSGSLSTQPATPGSDGRLVSTAAWQSAAADRLPRPKSTAIFGCEPQGRVLVSVDGGNHE